MAWTTPGTATAGEVLTAAFWNANVRDNSLELAPTGAAWTTWSPSYTNLAGGTTNVARYIQIGKFVACEWKYTLASAGVSGQVKLTLPVTASSFLTAGQRLGAVLLNSQGVDVWDGRLQYSDTTSVIISRLVVDGTAIKLRDLSSTQPFTWKSTDTMIAQWTYEAA